MTEEVVRGQTIDISASLGPGSRVPGENLTSPAFERPPASLWIALAAATVPSALTADAIAEAIFCCIAVLGGAALHPGSTAQGIDLECSGVGGGAIVPKSRSHSDHRAIVTDIHRTQVTQQIPRFTFDVASISPPGSTRC